MEAAVLSGGFAEPAREAAHAFRAIMNAMAHPGRIEHVAGVAPPAPISVAAGTLLLTLCDGDTPLHLAGAFDTPETRAWIAFHTGAPIVGAGACHYALGRWPELTPLDAYPMGTPDYPDRSATLIVECADLTAAGATLRGPGIRDRASLGLPETEAFRRNALHYPLGLDFIFTAGNRIAALPRSTRVED